MSRELYLGIDMGGTHIKIALKLKNYSKTKSIGVGIAGDVGFYTWVVRFSLIGAFWLDTKGKSVDLICVTLRTGVGGGLIFNSEKIKKKALKSAAKACKIVISKYTHKLGVVGAVMLPEQ